MKARVTEYASMRLPDKMRRQVTRMANEEKRSLSQMLKILVEEALAKRNATTPLPASRAQLQNAATGY